MAKKEQEHGGLAGRLLRSLGDSMHALASVFDDERLSRLLSLDTLATGEAGEVLRHLQKAVSLSQLRDIADLLHLDPCSVAIVGPVNAGKSTLLNVLAGRELAEVAATPGTTVELNRHDALGFTLIDTPGADEPMGEARRDLALSSVSESAITILLLDATRGVTTTERSVFEEVVSRIVDSEKRETPLVPDGELSVARLLERGRLIVAINKLDRISRSEHEEVRRHAAADLGIGKREGKKLLGLSAVKRTGLDELARRMVDGAPSMAEALSEVMPSYREDLANQMIFRYAATAATVALSPLPFSHTLPLTALQLALVIRIARIYGHEMTWRRTREVVPTVAAGIGWRELFRQVVHLVPVTGWALNGGIAYAGTYATGRTAQHMLRTGEKPTPAQLDSWRRQARERRARFSRQNRENPN